MFIITIGVGGIVKKILMFTILNTLDDIVNVYYALCSFSIRRKIFQLMRNFMVEQQRTFHGSIVIKQSDKLNNEKKTAVQQVP